MRRKRYCCLGIDPGPTCSGFVVAEFTPHARPIASVLWSGTVDNHELLDDIASHVSNGVCAIALESFQSYGHPVGKKVFEACRWAGRFEQRFREISRGDVFLVPNPDAKHVLCGRRNASEAELRDAVISLLGHVGRRGEAGPLYGVTGHAWSALAVVAAVFSLMSYPDKEGHLALWKQA